jgi:hypothetical protein
MKKEKRHVFITQLEKLVKEHYDRYKTNDSPFVVIGDLDTARTFSFYIDQIQVKLRIRVMHSWKNNKKTQLR